MPKHPHALVHPFRITLVAFIDDLDALEPSGLQPNQCDSVLACLDSIIQLLRTTSSASEWLPELLVPFSSLRADYFLWNNPREGSLPAAHRREQCKQIRKQKNGILPRFRFGSLFASIPEQQLFLRIYDEFIRLGNIRSVETLGETPFRKTVERAMEKRAKIVEIA